MKLLRRRSSEPDPSNTVTVDADVAVGKGRPTPKRRDTSPKRGPVSAPRTQKEARQRQTKQSRQPRAGAAQSMGREAYREALRRGDESVLPQRDRGPVRRLARDWVDSHRMLSNYLLILFPLMIVGYAIPMLQFGVLAIFFVIVGEWYLTGRRIRSLAISRLGVDKVRDGAIGLGFYAGSRAYMPRRWRMPGPVVSYGDQI